MYTLLYCKHIVTTHTVHQPLYCTTNVCLNVFSPCKVHTHITSVQHCVSRFSILGTVICSVLSRHHDFFLVTVICVASFWTKCYHTRIQTQPANWMGHQTSRCAKNVCVTPCKFCEFYNLSICDYSKVWMLECSKVRKWLKHVTVGWMVVEMMPKRYTFRKNVTLPLSYIQD